MTTGYNDIVLNNETLNVTTLTKRQIPSTYKQRIGSRLVKHSIPANTERDWEISCRGVIYDIGGTTAQTFRTNLEALNDLSVLNYADGLILASVIIEELTFDDSGDNPMMYNYNIKLIQMNQHG